MLEITERTFYVFLQNVTWVVLYTSMFAQQKRSGSLILLLRIVVLACLQLMCGKLEISLLVPPIMICGHYFLAQMQYSLPKKALAIEVAFTYALMELLCILCSLGAAILCVYIIQVPKYIAVTIVSAFLLAISWCVFVYIFWEKDLTALGERYSLGILAVIFVLFLTAFGIIHTPYVVANEAFYLFVLFVLAVCFALLIIWAWREHKVLREQERLDREMAALAHERDNLRSENHRLGKVLPGLEHQYGELAEWARHLRENDDLTEFSEELQTKRQTASQIRGALREQGGEGHSMELLTVRTGIDALDGVLSQAARSASLAGIRFDCRVWAKTDVLLCAQGITMLSLQQILSNLLDNALHAVELAGPEQRVVTCYLGQAEGGYQIEVLDSGAYFAPRILENLGRRGNTTDGNGIGLVHILEALAACNASLFISEFRTPHLGGAVKSVAVRFDGKAMAHLSVHAPEIEDVDVSIHSLLEREDCT